VDFQDGAEHTTRTVTRQEGRLIQEADLPRSAPLAIPPPGSVTEFCLERYSAFTRSPFGDMRFHIWHHPWEQTDTESSLTDDSLLRTRPYYSALQPAGAQYSPGATGVEIGLPKPLRR
jgi:uncharacterized protein YqjF (DUF2071 family)